MNNSKKMIFAFFMSTALMGSKSLMHTNHVFAASTTPNIQSNAYNSSNIFTKCGYKGQCTWFTYGRVLEKLGIALPSEFYGNAVDWWYANARDKIYSYGYEPKANSIIIWGGGSRGYGHVGFVEKVEGDTVYFNEGNFSVRGSYDGSMKFLSKEAIRNRGNLFLKGYIYVSGGSSSNNVTPVSTKDEPVIKTGTVNISSSSSRLNIRNSASTSSSVIGSLSKGASVSIVAVSGDWYKIKYNSSYGYVNSKYISNGSTNNGSSSNDVQSPTENKPVINSGIVNISNSSSYLNIRNSASTSSNIIGSLSKGANVSIVASSGDWYKIKYNSSYGYVSSKYISTKSANNNQPSNNVQAPEKDEPVINSGTVNVSSSYLNVRNSASISSNVVGALSKGANVSIVATSGDWYKIKYNSTYGYVNSKYINIASNNSGVTKLANTTNNSSKFGTVNVSNKSSYLNLRNTPSGTIIDFLPYDVKFQILGEDNGWYKVNYNGKTGYVASRYVKLSSDVADLSSSKTVSVTSTEKTLTDKIKSVKLSDPSSTLNLRNSPWTGRVLCQIPNGSNVEILSANGRWYKVKFESYVGYIHADYINSGSDSSKNNTSTNTNKTSSASSSNTGTSAVISKTSTNSNLSNNSSTAIKKTNSKSGTSISNNKTNTNSKNNVYASTIKNSNTSNSNNTVSSNTATNNSKTDISYRSINQGKLKQFLKQNNSLLADEPYFSSIISIARQYNLNPLILFAIAGSEQSFVPKNTANAYKIVNNPFNVHGSWQQYNTNINDSSGITARTVINLSKGMPANSDLFSYISAKYAQDTNWGSNTSAIFKQLNAYAQ